jgi:hypothetical protein
MGFNSPLEDVALSMLLIQGDWTNKFGLILSLMRTCRALANREIKLLSLEHFDQQVYRPEDSFKVRYNYVDSKRFVEMFSVAYSIL